MRVMVIGAAGKTAMHVWRKALEQGHDVSGFVRTASKLASAKEQINIVSGDVLSSESVSNAVAGHDAVIVCLGSTGLSDNSTLTVGTQNVIDGMVKHNVDRLIVISAAGIGESWQQIGWISRLLFKTMLKNVFNDHVAQEALVTQSSLDWTIVRAAILSNNPATGEYIASNEVKTGKIARADLAEFLVKQLTDSRYSQQAISVSS